MQFLKKIWTNREFNFYMAFIPLVAYLAMLAYHSSGIAGLKALGVGLIIGIICINWFTFFIKKSMKPVEKS